jgi:hypothetical protein
LALPLRLCSRHVHPHDPQKNPGSGQVYIYQQLIESVRTPWGPRQRILLNLGTLEIPPAEWKELANRIEALFLGQQEIYPAAPHLESLAQHYADLLRQQEFSRAAVAAEEAQRETRGDGRHQRNQRYHHPDTTAQSGWWGHPLLPEFGPGPQGSRDADLKRFEEGLEGLSYRWQTIRSHLAMQLRVTVAITNDIGERLYLRQTTEPEPFHLAIYRALGLPSKPLKTKRLRV